MANELGRGGIEPVLLDKSHQSILCISSFPPSRPRRGVRRGTGALGLQAWRHLEGESGYCESTFAVRVLGV